MPVVVGGQAVGQAVQAVAEQQRQLRLQHQPAVRQTQEVAVVLDLATVELVLPIMLVRLVDQV
jgi:hypothetical protein